MGDTQIQIKAGRSSAGANALVTPRGGPGSELVALDYDVAEALGGRMFIVNFGTATTPLSLAKTAYDEDQPQAVLRVPTGITVIPKVLRVYLETSAGTLNEIIAQFCNNDIGNGTSSAATVGPLGMHTAKGASQVTARQLYTGNATAATNLREFWRAGYPFADATTDPVKLFDWVAGRDGPPPVLEGPASLFLNIDGTTTAPTGYITAVYEEHATSDLVAAS